MEKHVIAYLKSATIFEPFVVISASKKRIQLNNSVIFYFGLHPSTKESSKALTRSVRYNRKLERVMRNR